MGEGDCHEDGLLHLIDHSASWRRLKRFGKIQNLPSVKDVELVVRPYKTRTAFAASSTIYLNEHLIDDEEILEYLVIRELIHIRLHMYR